MDAAQVVVSRSIGNSGSRRRKPYAALQTNRPPSRTAICAPVTWAAARVFFANESASSVEIFEPSKRRIQLVGRGPAIEDISGSRDSEAAGSARHRIM